MAMLNQHQFSDVDFHSLVVHKFVGLKGFIEVLHVFVNEPDATVQLILLDQIQNLFNETLILLIIVLQLIENPFLTFEHRQTFKIKKQNFF